MCGMTYLLFIETNDHYHFHTAVHTESLLKLTLVVIVLLVLLMLCRTMYILTYRLNQTYHPSQISQETPAFQLLNLGSQV